ncbi:Hxxxd-type acyl-transferase family protein [Thalictrum thalictroides]|uniref:Hxxxd-type acyl-transferase family protein n=1 Tax=Thalictrum thalictroides TaxID=46969 RepID=A0A7J6W455_THATH|nr:Hxxxd-type acyl-transferase family protein [Thalictrum thalictroides]
MTIFSQRLLFPNVLHSKIVSFEYHVSSTHPNMKLHTYLNKYSNAQFYHQFHFLKSSVSRSCSSCQSKKHDYCFRPSAVLESLEHTVTIHRTSLIFPLEETERKSMFLSNIDKRLNIKATAIFFFSRNPKFSFEQIVTKLESALRKILVHYDFLAGRLRWNIEGQLEIDCNAAGAGFVVASCNSSFEELGGIIGSSNVANQKFALRKWNALPDDQPLFLMQVYQA